MEKGYKIPKPPLRLRGFDYSEPRAYFATFNTFHRAPYFRDPALAARLVAIIIHARLDAGFNVFAFCIMPDHVHLLVQPTGHGDLPGIIRAIKGLMTAAFRKIHPDQTLWQTSYKDRIIRDEEEFRETLDYIIMNPVRCGLAADEFEYPFAGVIDLP